MAIDTDFTPEEIEKFKKLQKQYGLDSIEQVVEKLVSQHLMKVRNKVTGNQALPTWVVK